MTSAVSTLSAWMEISNGGCIFSPFALPFTSFIENCIRELAPPAKNFAGKPILRIPRRQQGEYAASRVVRLSFFRGGARLTDGIPMITSSTHEITELLQAWNRGDDQALEKLTPL